MTRAAAAVVLVLRPLQMRMWNARPAGTADPCRLVFSPSRWCVSWPGFPGSKACCKGWLGLASQVSRRRRCGGVPHAFGSATASRMGCTVGIIGALSAGNRSTARQSCRRHRAFSLPFKKIPRGNLRRNERNLEGPVSRVDFQSKSGPATRWRAFEKPPKKNTQTNSLSLGNVPFRFLVSIGHVFDVPKRRNSSDAVSPDRGAHNKRTRQLRNGTNHDPTILRQWSCSLTFCPTSGPSFRWPPWRPGRLPSRRGPLGGLNCLEIFVGSIDQDMLCATPSCAVPMGATPRCWS